MLQPISVPTAILLISILTLCGCGEWPPDEQDAREHFEENRENMQVLEQRLAATKYDSVKVSGLKMAEGSYKVERFTRHDTLEDSAEWNRLLMDASVNSVSRDEDAYFFSFGGDPFEGDSSGEIQFMHDSDGESDLIECQSDFEDARCGRCVVKLDDDWWIDYEWYPDNVAPEVTEAYADGELSDDKYWVAFGNALDACVYEGYSLIGYEMTPPVQVPPSAPDETSTQAD
jgi:hypothetical protein